MNEFWKWAKLIGFNVQQKRKQYVVDKEDIKKKSLGQNAQKILANTEYEICAEAWTKSYLKTIGSSGVIHSINTGKHAKFIMCNIRNMNTCKELHEDYFNDSTVYINLGERQFSIRCNRIPCNKKAWVWKPMI